MPTAMACLFDVIGWNNIPKVSRGGEAVAGGGRGVMVWMEQDTQGKQGGEAVAGGGRGCSREGDHGVDGTIYPR